jgi:hypothetical protein
MDTREPVGNQNGPHVPASALKLWFRELTDPVIPQSLYDQCIDVRDTMGVWSWLSSWPLLVGMQ